MRIHIDNFTVESIGRGKSRYSIRWSPTKAEAVRWAIRVMRRRRPRAVIIRNHDRIVWQRGSH